MNTLGTKTSGIPDDAAATGNLTSIAEEGDYTGTVSEEDRLLNPGK